MGPTYQTGLVGRLKRFSRQQKFQRGLAAAGDKFSSQLRPEAVSEGCQAQLLNSSAALYCLTNCKKIKHQMIEYFISF